MAKLLYMHWHAVALLCSTVAANEDTPQAILDEVHYLPDSGREGLHSRHYSGYLDNGQGGKLHYWFVESESDPELDPLALWLNGGPGASSLMGFLTEFGPYVISASGGVHYNPYNWAKRSNLLFFEAPAGVGFSYCKENVAAVCEADDDSTAAGNLVALHAFFERFPKLRGSSFMVWGESYAGVYVPTLAKNIAYADPPLPVNFLGFSVGNPCTADRLQTFSLSPAYALESGLIEDTLHKTLVSSECSNAKGERLVRGPRCRKAWHRFDLLTSDISGGHGMNIPGMGDGAGFLDPYDTGAYVGSMQPYWDAAGAYLNRADVRAALHLEGAPHWGLFATRLVYNKQYAACRDDGPDDVDAVPQHNQSMLPIYRELAEKGLSVLLYSGDEDPSVQWRGSERCVRGVGLPEAPGQAWRPWFYVEEAAPVELLAVKAPEWGQTLSASARRGDKAVLGGYIETFVPHEGSGSLTFATVRGVGHMVPQFRPQAALVLFDRTMRAAVLRRGSPPHLAPVLPSVSDNFEQDEFALSSTPPDEADDRDFYGDATKQGLYVKWMLEAERYAELGRSRTGDSSVLAASVTPDSVSWPAVVACALSLVSLSAFVGFAIGTRRISANAFSEKLIA
eukprot:TRINITY_DN20991_c0_g1_i2.p1 TRINITY_DN20991_c0_g1~~TRINITY_DN20991_c0_g1_i2.p1  ORF type:complete len:640 (-),score=84.73 TRINITY_DN20991_c0_g1_i2:145-2010(-)